MFAFEALLDLQRDVEVRHLLRHIGSEADAAEHYAPLALPRAVCHHFDAAIYALWYK